MPKSQMSDLKVAITSLLLIFYCHLKIGFLSRPKYNCVPNLNKISASVLELQWQQHDRSETSISPTFVGSSVVVECKKVSETVKSAKKMGVFDLVNAKT